MDEGIFHDVSGCACVKFPGTEKTVIKITIVYYFIMHSSVTPDYQKPFKAENGLGIRILISDTYDKSFIGQVKMTESQY